MYVFEGSSALSAILETLLNNELTGILGVLLVLSVLVDYLVYRSNMRLFEDENI